MITAVCQRWREHRDSYRPAGEVINPRDYEVAAIADDTTAKAFVMRHHYSGSFPAAQRRYGLYRREQLVGVAVYSPAWAHVVAAAGVPFPTGEVPELSRLVLLDDVPGNGETWFLARTTELLRADGFTAVISFADDVERTAADGVRVFGGHIGGIYQALSAIYTGRGRERTIRLLPDGSVLSDRIQSKIRRREQGWKYAVAELVRHGAAEPAAGEDLRGWLGAWRGRLTRAVRHHGCLRYVWPIARRSRRHLPTSLPYVKRFALA